MKFGTASLTEPDDDDDDATPAVTRIAELSSLLSLSPPFPSPFSVKSAHFEGNVFALP